MSPSIRRGPGVPAIATALILAAPILAGCGGGPSRPFDAHAVPPAPDYTKSEAWLALPGREGLERSTPAGFAVVEEAAAPADVFFIHPTTTKDKSAWNTPWDASDEAAPLNRAVLMGQASVFNGCCRIYAPHYRQASLQGLSDDGAVDLAYADVAAAFREFIAHRNDGRPFIIASHSQGTMHAIRLLQEEVLGTPLQSRMVAAYLVGGYVPDAFPELGLALCDSPDQTGCVLTWNTSKPGSLAARIIIYKKTYWWRGQRKSDDQAPAICVNPLTWRLQGHGRDTADAVQNPGSMPLPRAPWPSGAAPMPALMPHLTGARCHDGMLEVDIPKTAPNEYSDPLTRNFGSYHLNDYGLFYAALRENTLRRVQAWTVAHPAAH
jgi:hypothetical protein